MALKGVILSLENVVYHEGKLKEPQFSQFGKLIQFLLSRGVTPVVVANRTRTMTDGSGTLQSLIDSRWGVFPWFVADQGTGAWKPQAEAVERVLERMGWSREEVIFIGYDEDDMRTAKNGKVLFMSAEWYKTGGLYGLKFESPNDMGRFIALCCLREHHWFYEINEDGLEYFALGPYARSDEEFGRFSNDALNALKTRRPHTTFWVRYLCASLYLSGLSQRVNYLATFPGHQAGAGSTVLKDALVQVATCFGITFTSDLIERHVTVKKSAFDRTSATHLKQFNSIKLNRNPIRTVAGVRFKNPPLGSGKTVLVLDDICTEGFSFEAARHFVGQTRANTICVSFLKTVNRSYQQLLTVPKFDPYKAQTFAALPSPTYRSYSGHIVDPGAPAELDAALAAYDSWTLP